MLEMMDYEVVDMIKFKKRGRHFSEASKCATTMTAKIDVTGLVDYSERTGTEFYINFLYLLTRVMNSRADYRMGYLPDSDELVCYDQINPTQYVYREDTETFVPVYSTYYETYELFYSEALNDLRLAGDRDSADDEGEHPNWFDASYDSVDPDPHKGFAPSVKWGEYRKEGGRYMMPVSVSLNSAIADGYVVARVFRLLRDEICDFNGITDASPEVSGGWMGFSNENAAS